MAEDDLSKEIRELRAQIEALRTALSDITRPYSELMDYVERLQDVSRGYFRILGLYAKYGTVSPDVVIPGLKDDISRHIVVALFDRPDRNISQITESVKGKRGTASRRIVRERLEDLQRQGIVVATPGSRPRTFRVAEEVAEKWSQVLGVPKYQDQSHVDSDKAGERKWVRKSTE
jgi:DNA-binding HxlR family transcriptional regulator